MCRLNLFLANHLSGVKLVGDLSNDLYDKGKTWLWKTREERGEVALDWMMVVCAPDHGLGRKTS